MTVLIAGGGISGLALGLSLHQIGIPFQVIESSAELRPLGVGINLQPSAVRELYALGLEEGLEQVGIRLADYGLYSSKGKEIWTEPRGINAGYNWPQYSVHRGAFHMMLYRALIERAGEDAVLTGWRATGFENRDGAAILQMQSRSGAARELRGDLLIGADGIHSALRAQIAPQEGPPIWNGMVLWRGTSLAKPFLSGASMVMIGPLGHRIVSYPISRPDPKTGLATINWIAERSRDPAAGFHKEDYSRTAPLEDFLPGFEDMVFDWLDVPALIKGAEQVFEYPMVDRDPLPRWTFGRVSLMGDAAHAAYPVGSNGAGAGIMDARKLAAALLAHGLRPEALEAYEAEMRPATSKMVTLNRGKGPDQIIDLVEQRSGGQFDHINDVISHAEMAAHAANYKKAAGYGIDQTNDAPPILAPGARFTPV
ncbi:MAG: flavin-dependent oxidoreductase [Sulfitobacter sp.]